MKTLNERQFLVLQRIVLGEYRPASGDATTIYALRRRRLVTTKTAYAYGTAEPTEAGRALVDRQDSASVKSGAEPAAAEVSATFDVPSSPAELFDRLARSGDRRLVVADPTPEVRAAWRRLLYAARREQTAGGDMVLRHTNRARGDLVIWLEPPVEADITPTSVASVEIPVRVRGAHPLIAELRHITVGYSGWIDTHRMADVAHVRISPSSKQRTIRSSTRSRLRRNAAGTASSLAATVAAPVASGSASTDTGTNSPSSSSIDASRTC